MKTQTQLFAQLQNSAVKVKQESFWCESEKRGLGTVSAQTGESMHGTFEKFLERYKDLLLAISNWNAQALWAQPDDAGDQN